jgi:hypothetical protein
MFKNNGVVENSYGLTIVAAYSFFIGSKKKIIIIYSVERFFLGLTILVAVGK